MGQIRLLVDETYMDERVDRFLSGMLEEKSRSYLQKIIKENNIPSNVHLTSDSGWECDATEMNGVYYNEAKNEIVFTQEGSVYDYSYRDSYSWKNIYSKEDSNECTV